MENVFADILCVTACQSIEYAHKCGSSKISEARLFYSIRAIISYTFTTSLLKLVVIAFNPFGFRYTLKVAGK